MTDQQTSKTSLYQSIDMKQIIHIAGEAIVILGVVYYFSNKNKIMAKHIADLHKKLEEHEDTIQELKDTITSMKVVLQKTEEIHRMLMSNQMQERRILERNNLNAQLGVQQGVSQGVSQGVALDSSKEELPNGTPSVVPNGVPSVVPNGTPSGVPNGVPNGTPSVVPNGVPSVVPQKEKNANIQARFHSAPKMQLNPTTTMSSSNGTQTRDPKSQAVHDGIPNLLISSVMGAFAQNLNPIMNNPIANNSSLAKIEEIVEENGSDLDENEINEIAEELNELKENSSFKKKEE